VKFLALIFCSWLTAAGLLSAQVVSVHLEAEQDQFLPNEPLLVSVRVVNKSGQTLHLGKERDWLTFSVEARENFPVRELGLAPVEGAFQLESSLQGTKRVDLAPYFDLTRPGRYRISALVRVRQGDWNEDIRSEAKEIDIVSGTKLTEITFGVPRGPGEAGRPEVRKYVLVQAHFMKSPMTLYVRLTDLHDTKVFQVYPLGIMHSFTRPEVQTDHFNNLHVLHQTGARAFSYSVINPDGFTIARQRHDYTDTRPVLRADPEGNIVVSGGIRYRTLSDLPAPVENPPPF
jgi:hypothetical protein